MMKKSCFGCKYRYSYPGIDTMHGGGVLMHVNENFCTKQKKYLRLLKRHINKEIPEWCPLRKSPSDLRIYRIKDDAFIFLTAHPMECDYELHFEGHTIYTVLHFKQTLNEIRLTEILDIPFSNRDVIEIDDGINSDFIYYLDGGVESVYFNPSKISKVSNK